MIGNSFSVDAARYTHDISLGSDTNIEVGVLYVGGCSLEQHVNFFKNKEAPYENNLIWSIAANLYDQDYANSEFNPLKDPEILRVLSDYGISE